MKIVRIIARLNIGGPARNAVLLSESAGWGTVLVCGEVAEAEGDMMYLAQQKGIRPIIIKELAREISWKDDWRAFWKIYRIICREKPDIIHTHTAKAGALGRLAGILYNFINYWSKLKRRRCKLVHTFHGHVLQGYFGKIKTNFFIWVETILALFTNRILTVSVSVKKALVETFKIGPERKFSVIELGFDLDGLLNLSVKERSDCVNIGIVGRLVPVKNHRMLFRVISSIRCQVSDIRVRFIVVGDGELRQDLESYIKELGIEDMVEFKGWIKDLIAIYKNLDIVALTSLNEGSPVSIIEAMAAARPVIATNVGGVSDIVQDGKSGYLINSNDDRDFVEKLLDLIKDKEKRNRFGAYGRELVKERFSKERLINDSEKLYRDLLKDRQ